MASRLGPPSASCQSLLASTAALWLTFCIVPTSLAAANAQPARGRPALVTGSRGAGSAAPHAGSAPSSPPACCGVSSPPPPVASHDGRRGRAGAGSAPPSAPPEPAAQPRREERTSSSACCVEPASSSPVAANEHPSEAGAGRGRHRGRVSQPAEGSPEGSAPEGAAGAQAQAGATTLGRGRERPQGRHHSANGLKRPHRTPEGVPQVKQARPATTPHAAAASAAAIIPAAAAPAPAPAPAPAAAKAPAASTPQLIGSRRQSVSPAVVPSAGRRGARAAHRPPSVGALTRSPLAPAAALVAPPADAKGGGVTPRKNSKAPSRLAASQIVTTVTHIINVIPAAVQIALGALVALALALGISSRLASLRARRLARQRRQLLEDVGLLQAALLPPIPPRLGPVGTSSAYQPASGPGAGGDFYDMFALGDGQVAVIVGDVSGHGRSALPQTTLVRFTLRAYLEAGMSPRRALQMAAPVLERQLGESFATVVLATYHPRERTLVYACAGHPPPLVLGSEPIAPITVCSSPPIGAGQPTGTRQTVVSLPGESLVCFYTDGVLDARVGGQLFGVRRLKLALAELGPDATASALLDRVAEESDQRPDDMAACLLRVEGDRSAPSVQAEELELDRREAGRDRAGRLLLARGLDAGKVEHVIGAARSAVARDGAVVLELHMGVPPEVTLRPQNVAPFEPTIRARSRALEMSG
jgi:serine phosphatase RsbU (regulator of sigma subunit)